MARGVEVGGVHGVPGPAFGLGLVHGLVGATEQLRVVELRALSQGDPDAGRDERLQSPEVERPAQGLPKPPGDELRLVRVVKILEQHGELVPAEASGSVADAHDPGDARRDGDEQAIADAMPVTVVDPLEVVEIKEEDGNRAEAAPRPRKRVLDPVREERPIGEAGERVVERLESELALEPLALADVPRRKHEPADLGHVEHV